MKNAIKIYHWLPRALCILAILFISMFSLDAFEAGKSFSQQLADWMMHLIPSFVLLSLLLVAWKWEKTGGTIFILLGLVFSPLIYRMNYRMNHSVWISLSIILTITVPFIVVGVLFLVSNRKKEQQARRMKFLQRAGANA